MSFLSFATKIRDVLRPYFGIRAGKKEKETYLTKLEEALLEGEVPYALTTKIVRAMRSKMQSGALVRGEHLLHATRDCLQQHLLHREIPPCRSIMLIGLQGVGKTTTAAKVASYYQTQGMQPILVSCDVDRPAAQEQLQRLAATIDVPVMVHPTSPLEALAMGLEAQKDRKDALLIIDTAGRASADSALMDALDVLIQKSGVQERWYVAHAGSGKRAFEHFERFHAAVGLTGVILTMLDGDAKAGVALACSAAHVPILAEGTGEKLNDFRPFSPQSLAQRMVGDGDLEQLSQSAAKLMGNPKAMEEKLKKGSFTFEDILKQLQMLEKMGSWSAIARMLPIELQKVPVHEGATKSLAAIIQSMTLKERRAEVELCVSRRKRISQGSGVSLEGVHATLKRCDQLRSMLQKLASKNPSMMKSLNSMMRAKPWR